MGYTIRAACCCNTGKIRKNNEDNFYFYGKCLELENNGLKSPVGIETPLKYGHCFAVFDGMGGENFGEYASFSAARQLQLCERTMADFFVPAKKYLERVVSQLNDAVVKKQQELRTDRMGTTMVGAYFAGRYVYICNIGDSRAYRLRDREFLQLSVDHIEKRPGKEKQKAPLTQYLGLGSDEIQLDPYIVKGELKKGDTYLLCSDGLTDMLTNFEISDIMINNTDAETCAETLVQAALEHGGRDNITVIVINIER